MVGIDYIIVIGYDKTCKMFVPLDKFGVAVIDIVLQPLEVKRIKVLAWENISDWSNRLTDGNDPKIWKKLFRFYPKHAMMIRGYGKLDNTMGYQ